MDLLIPHGERRGRYYTGTAELIALARATKVGGRADDSYELVRERREAYEQPRLDL